MSGLFRRKAMSDLQEEAGGEHGMKRTLGPVNLTAIGIGGIIGAGIFVLTGQAAANYAGPAIVLSFVLAAVACGFAGLCYAEFASMIPISGSAYTYSYATLGEFFAWFIGWDLVLEYAMGAATVAVGWSGYVVSFLRSFGIHLPPQVIASPGTEYLFLDGSTVERLHSTMIPTTGWYTLTAVGDSLTAAGISLANLEHATALFNLPAVLVIGLVTSLLVVGIQESANVNAAIVVLKLIIIVTVIAVGVGYINTANWHPFIPPAALDDHGQAISGKFGWSGVARGAGVIFFAYIGFDAVSTAAQEAKNPQRDMPIGILGSLVLCTILYILVALCSPAWCPTPSSRCRTRSPSPSTRWASRGSPRSSSSARSPASPPSSSCCSWASRASSSRCRATASCPRSSRACTRASARPTSPPLSPASSSRWSPRWCRSSCSASWCPSAR